MEYLQACCKANFFPLYSDETDINRRGLTISSSTSTLSPVTFSTQYSVLFWHSTYLPSHSCGMLFRGSFSSPFSFLCPCHTSLTCTHLRNALIPRTDSSELPVCSSLVAFNTGWNCGLPLWHCIDAWLPVWIACDWETAFNIFPIHPDASGQCCSTACYLVHKLHCLWLRTHSMPLPFPAYL